MIEITIHNVPEPENDRRYRVLVLLQRSDRPKYWVFHCPNCKREIREVNNASLLGMTDSFAASEYGTGIRCDTGWCRYYYYFQFSD